MSRPMILRKAHLFVLGALLVSYASAQKSNYPLFETDKISPAEHKGRREKVKAAMGPGTFAVFFTNPERNRNNDVDFQFRGDSNFLYLTGFEEPDAALVLIPDGVEVKGRRVTEVLCVNVANSMSETWLGYRMGPENAEALIGVEAALPNTEFTAVLPSIVAAATGKKVGVANIEEGIRGTMGQMHDAYRTWRKDSRFDDLQRVGRIVTKLREIKSPAEIVLLKKAAEISARAHVEALRSIEPEMREWEISALVSYIFAREGCEYTGYPPICGSGPNSTILHYNTNRRLMKSGDIMCMDTAGEYHGYSADVTRSFPINGKFTKEQRAIYELVLKSQEAGIKACRAGVTTGEVGRKCSEVLASGLMELGIIKNLNELGRYYMHGFGHGIGLDVHDPLPGTLAPGAVLTVEPGIYIKAGSPCDQKWWNIGVRIEDDIVVTAADPMNLSIGCPRSVVEVEKLMAEKGIGNMKERPIK